MIALREYQLEAVESVFARHQSGVTRQLVSLATGLGKTLIFSEIAKRINRRTIIIAHRDELIWQAREKLLLIWPEIEGNIGIVKGDIHDPGKPVVIASIQSASRGKRLKDLQNAGFDLCIIDEAHHSAAPTYEKLVHELGFMSDDQTKMLLGVTATPKRGDGVGLSSIFQEIVFNRSIAWGIKNSYLSPLIGRRISTRVSLKGVHTQAGDFVAAQLSRTINVPGRNKLVVESYQRYGSDRKKTLAFCADVRHAKDLAAMFNVAGVSSAALHGKMDIGERRNLLESFESGKIRILTNCGVLTEGFDSPQVDSILLCRPTQSPGLYVQCVGRGTRVSPGKSNCLVMDFVDASRHSLCNFQNSLEGVVASPPEDIERREKGSSVSLPIQSIDGSFETSSVQEIDFFGNSLFAWVQVGDAWHLPISENKDIWVRRTSANGYRTILHESGITHALSKCELPLEYSTGIAEDWVRNTTTGVLARKDASWRNEAPSEKQLVALGKFGIRDQNLTKGSASDMLRIMFHSKSRPFANLGS